MTHTRWLPLLVWNLVLLATNCLADTKNWEIRSETVYSKGDYGSDITTEVLYAPLEIRRKFEWGELGVAVPYLWYRTKGSFTYFDPGATPQLRTVPVSGSASGLADLLFDAEYRILSQTGNRPEILLHGYWKPPTADDDNGLGTGTHDWIVGMEFWSWLPDSEQWFYFGNVYRYFAGEAPMRNIGDSWIYDFGVGGLATSDLVLKLSYGEQTAVAPLLPRARSVNLESEFKVNPDLKLLSEISLGVSTAAPDWSFMLGFERAF